MFSIISSLDSPWSLVTNMRLFAESLEIPCNVTTFNYTLISYNSFCHLLAIAWPLLAGRKRTVFIFLCYPFTYVLTLILKTYCLLSIFAFIFIISGYTFGKYLEAKLFLQISMYSGLKLKMMSIKFKTITTKYEKVIYIVILIIMSPSIFVWSYINRLGVWGVQSVNMSMDFHLTDCYYY